jgi:polar amino acid transport system substrate-binding protein
MGFISFGYSSMALAGIILFVGIGPAAADPIQIMVHERVPYYVISGPTTVGGLVGKPAAVVLADSGVDYEWRVTSANAQLNIIKANKDRVCAVGWFKNAAREAFAKFTRPIYQGKPLVVVARSDNARVLGHQTFGDLLGDRAIMMGGKLGYSYGSYVDAKIAALAPRAVTTSQNNDGMIRMLLGRRFDYIFATPEESSLIIEGVGSAAQDLITVTMSDAPPGNKRYILCSKSVEDSVIDKLNAAIESQGGAN